MIGIVNVQWFDNPGAVLLCYALQQTVKDIKPNEKVQIINYTRGGGAGNNNILNKCKKVLTKVRGKILHQKKISGVKYELLLRKRHEYYEDFRKRYLNRTEEFRSIKSDILKNSYTHCIVGSDVVWKPEITKTLDAQIYFLRFADKTTKKIAYAASIGTEDNVLLQTLAPLYKKLLVDFDVISMREESGVKFIQNLTQKHVEEVIDPVFFCSKDDYVKMISEKKAPKNNYIYLYMLSPNMEAVHFARNMAEEKGLKIVFDIHTDMNLEILKEMPRDTIVSVAAGPIEFLANVYYADYVVTDSFHGTSFSLIFHKEFFTYRRISNGVDISTRMINLLHKMDLQSRYNVKDVELLSEKIDYFIIDQKILKMKEQALRFLEEALN